MRSLAAGAGVSHSTLSRAAHGKIVPGRATAAALERVTGGKVPARFWERLDRERTYRITAKE